MTAILSQPQCVNPFHTKFMSLNIEIHKFAFSIISRQTGGWNPSSWNTRISLSCIFNVMAADDLVTQGAWASVTIIMTHFSRIFWFQHHQGLSLNSTQIFVTKKKGILCGHQSIDINGSEQDCNVSYTRVYETSAGCLSSTDPNRDMSQLFWWCCKGPEMSQLSDLFKWPIYP